MAEGGLDDYELEDMSEKYPEYEDMDNDALRANYDDLRVRVEDDRWTEGAKERFNYVKRLMLVRGLDDEETRFTTSGGQIPNISSDRRTINTSITRDRKKFLSEKMYLDVNVKDGENSKKLIRGTKIIFGVDGNQNGIEYKGVKVVVTKNKGKTFEFSKNKNSSAAVAEYKNLMKEARKEHDETTGGQVDLELRNLGVTPNEELTQDIVSNVGAIIETEVEEREERYIRDASNISVSGQEVADLRGVLQDKNTAPEEQIEGLEAQADHYRLRALNESDQLKEDFYKGISDTAKLKADGIRLRNNMTVEGDEAKAILEKEVKDNDLTRLERFKKWAKENMVGLSAVAISIAGIVTSIIVAGRKIIKQGAGAVSKFAKAVASLGKKMGPLLSSILSIVASALSWATKGLMWLSHNLWLLVIAAAYAAYYYWTNRRKKQNVS